MVLLQNLFLEHVTLVYVLNFKNTKQYIVLIVNFSKKIVMIISFYDYKIIQLWMAMSVLLLFLKTHNHFEISEHIWRFDINIIIYLTNKIIFILWNQSYHCWCSQWNQCNYYLNKLCKVIYHIHIDSKF